MLLITNIKELVNINHTNKAKVCGKEMSDLQTIKNAYLIIKDGIIADFGKMENVPDNSIENIIDADKKMVFPCFCDSHTHLIYPASREIEFIDKIKGLSYEDIARRGGGILNSAKKLHETSEEELFKSASARLDEITSLGTGAVEIKSGYGLNTANEIKMLRVIKQLKKTSPLTIKATFLGAHAIPSEYKGKQDEYVNLIINEMIPIIASEDLADYIDVFCDRGFFTPENTERILMAGIKYGLQGKIHANELDFSGGVQAAVKYGALTADHLEYVGEDEISAFKTSETMPVVLPGAAFFLGMKLAPVRKMIEAGLAVALASDYNPGSSPSGNMQLIMAMGSIMYKMLPEEVINAVTTNGAYAMGISHEAGNIAKGKKANVFITTEIPSYEFMPYSFGSNKVETVIINGKIIIK